MSVCSALRDRPAPYVALWVLAGVCFGLAVTETTVLGFEQDDLLLMTTVFAAVTAEYTRRSDSRETGTES